MDLLFDASNFNLPKVMCVWPRYL